MNAPLWLIVTIAAVTDFIIVATATLTGAMTTALVTASTSAAAQAAWPSRAAWLLAIMFGLGAAAKEVRSQLKLGPATNGNGPGR